jgi:hypothetical protein
MEYQVIEPNTNNIVRHTNTTVAQTELLQFLWLITINKSKTYKIKYNYNYSNTQTIEIIDKETKYIHKFINVPVKMGVIDSDKLQKETRQVYKETYAIEGGE